MKSAVLFWFYKDPAVCTNRLQLIKKYNPKLPIFGLYGGAKKDAGKYKKLLSQYLDDFFISSKHNQAHFIDKQYPIILQSVLKLK